MNSRISIAQGCALMRGLFALLCGCFVLSTQVIPLAAQDRGNTAFQEYGDTVYRQLDPKASFGYDYNHAAIFAGFDSGNNANVMAKQVHILLIHNVSN